jgi:hypothetical protein
MIFSETAPAPLDKLSLMVFASLRLLGLFSPSCPAKTRNFRPLLSRLGRPEAAFFLEMEKIRL